MKTLSFILGTLLLSLTFNAAQAQTAKSKSNLASKDDAAGIKTTPNSGAVGQNQPILNAESKTNTLQLAGEPKEAPKNVAIQPKGTARNPKKTSEATSNDLKK